MPTRSIGASLVLATVGAIGLIVVVATAGLDVVDPRGPGTILVVGCAILLGAGLALLSAGEPLFGGTFGRRGLRALAIAVVAESLLLGLSTTPDFHGYRVMVLFIPMFVMAWVTVIGAGMTLLALIGSIGPARNVGKMFLLVPIALIPVNGVVNLVPISRLSPADARLMAISLATVVLIPLLAGFVGLARLGLIAHPPRPANDERRRDSAP